MLAAIVMLLAVSAFAWTVLACDRPRVPSLTPAAGVGRDPTAGPTYVASAPGGTVVVADRVTILAAAPPTPDAAPERRTPARYVASTRVTPPGGYAALPSPDRS